MVLLCFSKIYSKGGFAFVPLLFVVFIVLDTYFRFHSLSLPINSEIVQFYSNHSLLLILFYTKKKKKMIVISNLEKKIVQIVKNKKFYYYGEA